MANETYTLIQSIELNASAASITLSNIPQTFTDLVVKISSRCDVATTQYNSFIRPNAATTGYREVAWYFYTTSILPITGANTSLYYSYAVGSTALANTFSSNEIYINNYSSTSLFKQFSIDSSVENNNIGTGYVVIHDGGTWASTSQMTSLYLSPEAGNYVAGTRVSLYGVAKSDVTPTGTAKASGGDVVTNDGTYWYHAFKNSGAFTPFAALSCQALVIAGGGAGGGNHGGGGGAGGVSYNSSMSALAQTYPVIIGGGGSGAVNFDGTAGINSSFNSIISNGGGIGSNSSNPSNTLYPGGSGGGGIAFVSNPGGLATQGNTGGATGYGNNGGTGGGYSSGGGGGAGGVGGNGSGNTGGTGGAGLNTWSTWASATNTGVSGYYAGGAGGFSNGSGGSAGGSGGGGVGGTSIYYGGTGVGGTGVANTGSGGGGTVGSGYGGTVGNGGSGLVIIRYLM